MTCAQARSMTARWLGSAPRQDSSTSKAAKKKITETITAMGQVMADRITSYDTPALGEMRGPRVNRGSRR